MNVKGKGRRRSWCLCQKKSIWCAGLSCLSRSSSHRNEKDQIDQKDRIDKMDQSPATRREMFDCKTCPSFSLV